MVDYYPIHINRQEPDPEPIEDEQDVLQPVVDVVYNVYKENGNAQSIALKISIKLPQQS
jgi:hypothetical protein